jgi:hypothetical protein
MTSVPDGKQSPADGPIERDPPVSSSVASTSSLLVLARYYFNLTDGETMIRDEEAAKHTLLCPNYTPRCHARKGQDGSSLVPRNPWIEDVRLPLHLE